MLCLHLFYFILFTLTVQYNMFPANHNDNFLLMKLQIKLKGVVASKEVINAFTHLILRIS